MRKTLIAVTSAMALAVTASAANAQVRERTVTGAAIGAGVGAAIAGPPGAVAGGVTGAVIGGPRFTRSRHCWIDRHGYRKCRWR
jgi:osmotically inducible lipoprotein OsmB